ncbi:hypothetical protein ACYPKM_03830 [Pseudomonas aeruginosa]
MLDFFLSTSFWLSVSLVLAFAWFVTATLGGLYNLFVPKEAKLSFLAIFANPFLITIELMVAWPLVLFAWLIDEYEPTLVDGREKRRREAEARRRESRDRFLVRVKA